MYNGIENITICDHPLLKHKLSILRNKNTGTNEFRKIVEEIAMFVGYEALRELEVGARANIFSEIFKNLGANR